MPDALSGRRLVLRLVCVCAMAGVAGTFASSVVAADKWVEVKSPHITVMSNGGARDARSLAWQLEQIRTALVSILPWAQVDLDRPFVVLAVDTEPKMRALVPEYWERRGGVRPGSVWTTSPYHHYLAIRSDLKGEDKEHLNPHVTAYFSYISLVLQQSIAADMPLWFRRGLAGVLSNTIVRDSDLLIGAPIPWNLEYLRDRSRLRLPALVAVTADSRELKTDDGFARFDAQSWAFVHFLMFGNQGARMPKINEFFSLVTNGTAPDAAMAQSIGKVDELEGEFIGYVNRSIFTFGRMAVDVSVKREAFPARDLTPAQAASTLALFHAARGRAAEAREAIASAGTTGAAQADSHLTEALLLDREGKADEARAALDRATSAGSTNAYAYYRLASLRLGPSPTRETLADVAQLLARAVELNPRHARGFAFLAEVQSRLGNAEALGTVARAIKLEPFESDHRLTAARILSHRGQHGDALKAVEAALKLASSDDERKSAQELQQHIERARGQ